MICLLQFLVPSIAADQITCHLLYRFKQLYSSSQYTHWGEGSEMPLGKKCIITCSGLRQLWPMLVTGLVRIVTAFVLDLEFWNLTTISHYYYYYYYYYYFIYEYIRQATFGIHFLVPNKNNKYLIFMYSVMVKILGRDASHDAHHYVFRSILMLLLPYFHITQNKNNYKNASN